MKHNNILLLICLIPFVACAAPKYTHKPLTVAKIDSLAKVEKHLDSIPAKPVLLGKVINEQTCKENSPVVINGVATVATWTCEVVGNYSVKK